MIIEAEIDLHNYNLKTQEEIYYFVEKFIDECFENGYKNIRIITGRGLHSTSRQLVKPATKIVLDRHKKVLHYRLDPSLGAFEISLIS